MKCSNCGNVVPDGEKFCPKCGSKVENKSVNNQNTKYCSNCGEQVEENSEFCSHCGATTNKEKKSNENSINNQNTKFCANCGAKINANAVACPKCGASIAGNAGVSEEKSVGLSVVLSILLPGLGHFYLGLHIRGFTFLIAFLVSLCTHQFYISVIIWTICLIDIFGCAKRFTKGEHIKDSIF